MSIDTQLPLMAKAFRTTVTGDGRYEMVFRFQSMDELHAADDEWRADRLALREEVRITERQSKSLHNALVASCDSFSPPSSDALREALEQWKCDSCGGSGFYTQKWSKDRGSWTEQCKRCEGSGKHPIARQALSQPPTIAETGGATAAIETIIGKVIRGRKGTDDWFDLVEIEALCKQARSALSPVRSGEGLSKYPGLPMSDADLNRHYEASKYDRDFLVGSEVRQLIGEIRHYRALSAETGER